MTNEKILYKHFSPDAGKMLSVAEMTDLMNTWLSEQPEVKVISVQITTRSAGAGKWWNYLHVWYRVRTPTPVSE
jgi:hypothetical protein